MTLFSPKPLSPDYYSNMSTTLMKDVLVVTLPQRNYTELAGSNLTYNDTVSSSCWCVQGIRSVPLALSLTLCVCAGQINDFVAGYHDGALLFGKVLRERMLQEKNSKGAAEVPLDYNPFGNASFYGACHR